MKVNLITFGFNKGDLEDVFYIIDTRGIKNPHSDPWLRDLTGYDGEVREQVIRHPKAKPILAYCLSLVANSPNNEITLGIGCTGGNHRSVSIALELMDRLEDLGHTVNIVHRDMRRKEQNDYSTCS